jgi:hypothetical protein
MQAREGMIGRLESVEILEASLVWICCGIRLALTLALPSDNITVPLPLTANANPSPMMAQQSKSTEAALGDIKEPSSICLTASTRQVSDDLHPRENMSPSYQNARDSSPHGQTLGSASHQAEASASRSFVESQPFPTTRTTKPNAKRSKSKTLPLWLADLAAGETGRLPMPVRGE